LHRVILDLVPLAKRNEVYGCSAKYDVPSADIRLGALFHMLEKNRRDVDIVDYSVSQTTLEQVFISLSKHQK
jgi:ATP-binding cassette subfamily A (ABC1) protein 3